MEVFFKHLITWYKRHQRDLPWRHTNDPYIIWLSEIILQQTRVDQGMSYFYKFTDAYPTVQDLAKATEDEVLNLWQGLGYYSRGRNLLKAAIQVVEEFNGVFPNNFNDLKKLKGVGDYSAAAIASFAFKEKVAVVDGNVYRVLSRFFNVDIPIDTGEGKKTFQDLANQVLNLDVPDLHNQAMMELGAMVCSPRNPQCDQCPLAEGCASYRASNQHELPVKSKKINKKTRHFLFIYNLNKGEVLLQKRGEKDIWANMFQFPLIELEQAFEESAFNTQKVLYKAKHILTHQTLFCTFIESEYSDKKALRVPVSALSNYAFPVVIENFLNYIATHK